MENQMSNVGARQVGEYVHRGRPIIRSIKNPIDKSTIVSIFPREVIEKKNTIEPGIFQIKPGSVESPSTLIIGSSSWWRPIDENQPTLEIPVSSVQVAQAVINDYCNGMLGCNMVDAMPGLFFILGEVSSLEVKMKYKDKLLEVEAKQNNWYKILVRLADSLWARANGNPLTISDEMRLGARSLNLNDKPWLLDFNTIEMVKCFACGSLKNPTYPICPTCRAIDPTSATAKDIKFAGQ
jgi:hypothetical protein